MVGKSKAHVITKGIPDALDRDEPRAVGFVMFPVAFLADLIDAEKSTLKVYLTLCGNANNETRKTWISEETIARRTGLCVRSVRYALRWLEDRKWIIPPKRRPTNDVIRYKIWFHPALGCLLPTDKEAHPRHQTAGQPSADILHSNSEEPAPWDC